jgi:hypothetical protein
MILTALADVAYSGADLVMDLEFGSEDPIKPM